MMKRIPSVLLICISAFASCTSKSGDTVVSDRKLRDSISVEQQVSDTIPVKKEVKIEKDLLFDKHILADTYPYKDTTRGFQWDKIRERLELIESISHKNTSWGILQNYKNKNGEAPLIRNYRRDAYNA